MSEYEHHRGRAIALAPAEGEDTQQMAKRLLDELGTEVADYYHNDYVECLTDEHYDTFVLADGIVYRIIETEDVDPYDDIIRATKNEDDSVSFELRYYNGGCGFGEAFEEAVKKMK